MTQQTRPVRPDRTLARVGGWCLAAGIVGALQAAIVLAWSPQVSEQMFSYPFTPAGFTIAQITFALQHLPLVAAAAALLRVPAVRASRVARLATIGAVTGLVLLTLMEFITISAHGVHIDSDHAVLVQNLYGPPVILIGISSAVAGIALLRGGRAGWTGAPWLPAVLLALGVYVFVPLTPAIMGSFVAGRLGIGGWMLLFALLGHGLVRLGRATSPRVSGRR